MTAAEPSAPGEETTTSPAPEKTDASPVSEETAEAQPQDVTISSVEMKRLLDLAAKAEEYQDKLLRTHADWDNYRKRAVRDRDEAVKYAGEALLEKLLPVLDNFEMGMQAAQNASDAKSIALGFQMVQSQFQNVLKEAGIEEIPAVGQTFDPHKHEALGEIATADQPEGTIVQQTRKGYKLKDRLLRAAAVLVAKSPEGEGS